tara:strand:+ start:12064 stop:13074 length:1011 start_codon:yes stop_codon:yes gene_type:complete
MDMTIIGSRATGVSLNYDVSSLDILYRGRLVELRELAESKKISKSGSVEVLRARLIQSLALQDLDLSWDGIQSMSHNELGEVLKIFGIKSSGSQRERRQRLWLHLNFDSRRMTIEKLAGMDRDDLHELCIRLEAPLTGNRTVLMGRVAGVLTNQLNGWGRIKRSLRRNGIKVPLDSMKIETDEIEDGSLNLVGTDFHSDSPIAVIEDAYDSLVLGIDTLDQVTQEDLRVISASVGDLDRVIGTILRGSGGIWGENQKELLLRLAKRRGWPVSEEIVKSRFMRISTDIAEIRGARIGNFAKLTGNSYLREKVVSETSMKRIRDKMNQASFLLDGTRS